MPPPRYGEHGRIVMVGPGSKRRILTTAFHSAADPDVSFDGARMLFAGKRGASDPWRIFEMDLATQEVRDVTRGPGSHRSPIYQGMLYTITAKEPWETITYVASPPGAPSGRGTPPATSLHACKLDGSEARRISFNPFSALDPAVLPDGRLLFSQWQGGSPERGLTGRAALFTSHIDGIDYAIFSGDEGRRIKRMPCVTARDLAVFVESEAAAWDGAGSLAAVSLRRNLHSYRRITSEGDGVFHSPSPLPDGTILVSRRPADGTGTHGVVRLDPISGRILESLFDDPERHDVGAKLIAPRTLPDGRSSVLSEDQPTGTLYGLNVYTSDLEGRGWITSGTPYRLRVLEGIPGASEDQDGADSSAEGTPPPLQKRFLGEIDIEEDGSFNVQVPANTPIQVQIVDRDGVSMRSCDWIWARNKEARGCVGCHEDGELAPENRFATALGKPSIPLDLPPPKRRAVDFRRDVMPILARKCASPVCHGGGVAPGLDGASAAYESLLAPVAGSGPSAPTHAGRYVHAGRARTSPLVWRLFGRDTSRPWDAPNEGDGLPGTIDPTRSLAIMPPPGSKPLTVEERRALIEWIDLGALREGLPDDTPRGTAAAGGGTR